MSLIEVLKEVAPSRSPIRDAVAPHMVDIEDAIAEGYSLSSIFVALKKEGHNVGKGISSFTNAVNFLRNKKSTEHSDPVSENEQAKSETAPNRPRDDTSVETGHNPFADNRHASDFGGE